MCQWGHCLSPVAGFEPASTKCPKALSPSSLQMCAVYVWIISNSIHQRIEADTCIPQQFMLVLPPLLSSVKQCVQRYVGVIKTLLCETSWNKAVPPASAMRSPRTTDPVGIFSSSLRRANSAWSLTKLGHRTPQRFWHFDCYPCIESCRVISRMTKPILTCFDLRAWCFFPVYCWNARRLQHDAHVAWLSTAPKTSFQPSVPGWCCRRKSCKKLQGTSWNNYIEIQLHLQNAWYARFTWFELRYALVHSLRKDGPWWKDEITCNYCRCSTMFKVCIQHSFNLYSSLKDVLPFSSFFPQYEVAICFTTVLQATLLRLLEATAATAAGCAVSWAAQPLLRLPSSWPPALRDVRDRESEGE